MLSLRRLNSRAWSSGNCVSTSVSSNFNSIETRLIPDVNANRKHGTYRPTLLKQVASNSIEDIRTITHDAFATYEGTRENEGHVNAVTALSKLKGVGPATASLLLSCYDPVMVPFFSDELYRYLNWEEDRSKGWDRKIGYTLREYKELWNRLHILRLRLEHEGGQEVKAVDIEKMAYALGKSARQSSSLGKREDIEDDKEAKPPSPKKRRKAALPPHKRPTGMPNERTIRLPKF